MGEHGEPNEMIKVTANDKRKMILFGVIMEVELLKVDLIKNMIIFCFIVNLIILHLTLNISHIMKTQQKDY